MKNILLVLTVLIAFITSCKKDNTPPPVTSVPEKLELTPGTQSVMIGSTVSYVVKYTNNLGVVAATPANIVWSSANAAIATVNAQGIVTGVATGQTEIKVSLGNTVGTALVSVVANASQLATVVLSPATTQEVLLNSATGFTATGQNSMGGTVNNLTFTWNSDASNIVNISNSGVATALAYGTAKIKATADMIQSNPVELQVIRRGNMTGAGSAGTIKLKSVNGVIKLETSSNFSVSTGAPDLRLYLTNTSNPTSIAGAVQVADLARPSQYSGAHSWDVPAGVTMTNYRYVFAWCLQVGGNYGNCDLGQ